MISLGVQLAEILDRLHARHPPHRYQWYQGHQKLEGVETETGDGLLKLSNVQRDMGGNYSVTASSVHGAITSSFTVNVLCMYPRLALPRAA